MKVAIAIVIALAFLLTSILPALAASRSASSVPASPSVADLKAKYADALSTGKKVRILVVPGHEPEYGGTEYQGFYEREMVLEIAEKFAGSLAANPRYQVFTTRDAAGWSPEFAGYFDRQGRNIERFVAEQKRQFERKMRRGHIEERTEEVPHAAARTDVALRLYGINRWANENGIDLLVHLHINDTGGGEELRQSTSGYAIYVPDHQYQNSKASIPVAEAVANRLSFLSATSTLPVENQGIVEDQSLIAIGAYDTLSAPSVLIEYGYITEEKFLNTETRRAVSTDFAFQTYRGLQDFFDDPVPVARASLNLPYAWKQGPPVAGTTLDAYLLQLALRSLGFYPGSTKNLVECPVSGVWDACTEDALKAFQASKGFEQTGAIGPKTKAALTAAGV